MLPWFPNFEYNMPGFPDDPYGFTKAERLKWSKLSIDYLLNDQNKSFFDQYKLSDGSPLYNDRELAHMDDVKRLVHQSLIIWDISGFVFLILFALAYRSNHFPSIISGFRWGGYFTLAIIATVLLAVATNFDVFFTQFHALFFKGNSWIFYYSDTFIRLFPIRFWQDCFIYIGVMSLLLSGAVIILPSKWIK